LADLFRGVNLSLGFLNLSIHTALTEAAELPIVEEFYQSALTISLLGDHNGCFSFRLSAVSV
jgi:hypothetical protein